MTERLCILCGQPLPTRSRWDRLTDWFLEPPPFHDTTKYPACYFIMRERLEGGPTVNLWVYWSVLAVTWAMIIWGWMLRRRTTHSLDEIMEQAKHAAESMYVTGWLEAKSNALIRLEHGDDLTGNIEVEMEMAKARFGHLWDNAQDEDD